MTWATSKGNLTPRTLLPMGSVLILGLLCSATAWGRAAVTIVEFNDSTSGKGRGEKIRSTIARAVQEADAVDMIPYSRIKSFAASRRVRTSELVKPKVLGRIAQAAGAEAAVTGSIARIGRELKLSVHIYDVRGTEVWSKVISLPRGELPAATAQRFAAAIAAAVGVQASEKPAHPAPAPRRAPEPVPEAPRASKARPEPVEEVEEVEQAEEVPERQAQLGPDDEPSSPITVPQPRRKPKERRQEPVRDESELDSSREDGSDDELARPGWVELSTDVSFVWRNYQFCPEVEDCAQSTPTTAGMPPVKYSTDKPYAGYVLRADIYPLRSFDSFIRGLGASVTFGRSLFLRTHYSDDDGSDQVFESTQQRFAIELLYRFYFSINGVGSGWAGLRGGWMHHGFFVDPNPKIVESSRGGLFGQLDLGMPLHRFLRVEGRATLIPYANPGEVEQAKYGVGDPENNRATKGGGWSLEGGLTSDFGHPEWRIGLQAMFEYLYFGDRYNNPVDVHPEYGRATESYMGFRVGLKTHL